MSWERAERAEIEARFASEPALFDLDAVRLEIDVMVRDLRALFDGGEGRVVLKRLLGDERLRVRPDSERGFAVEGEFLVAGSRSGSCTSGVQGFSGSGGPIRQKRRVRWELAGAQDFVRRLGPPS